MAKHPAAFINIIAEDGDKAEALRYLQDTWDEYIDATQAIAYAVEELRVIAKHAPMSAGTRTRIETVRSRLILRAADK